MNVDLRAHPPGLALFQKRALTVGLIASAVLLLGLFLQRERFFQSYLVGLLFWLSLSLGSLAIVMLQHLSGGAWGIVVRRVLEAGMRTLPLMALLFIPIFFGMHDLFEWTHADVVAADEVLQHKAPYLNTPFFAARAVLYFAIWIALSTGLSRLSRRQDSEGPVVGRQFQFISAPGLGLFVLTMTFASVDWVMSLEPHWFSTIYGALLMVGQGVAAMCLAIVSLAFLSRSPPLSDVLTRAHLHDLGKLLLAFVMVWAYFGFSQYLIIWSGNLPEEIPWYIRRLTGGWQWMALALVVLHFALPFLILLSRNFKRSSSALVGVALMLLFMRLVDLHWTTVPAFRESAASFHWLDPVAPVAIGGLWLAFFARELQRMPLIPLNDPGAAAALEHGRHEHA